MLGGDLRAVLFDFDGTILDTEAPEYLVWRELFGAHGCELEMAEWGQTVGTLHGPKPVALLEARLGRPVDRPAIEAELRSRVRQEIAALELRPGIPHLIEEAVDAGLALAIVTSSSERWVRGHLNRLGGPHHWSHIVAANDDPARSKPAPLLYLEACRLLGIKPDQALAIEDSPPGVAAAKAAGLRCVAYPNPVTRHMDLSAADAVVDDLRGLSLAALVGIVTTARLRPRAASAGDPCRRLRASGRGD